MDEAARIKKLIDLGFREHMAIAWTRSAGRCEYCHIDLIADRYGWAMQQTDHLLPRRHAKYLTDHRNTVISCILCNSVKHDVDVLKQDEDIETMLDRHRGLLIRRARTCIFEARKPHDSKLAKSKVRTVGELAVCAGCNRWMEDQGHVGDKPEDR